MKSILGSGFKYSCEARLPSGEVITFDDSNLLPQQSIDLLAGLIRATTSPIGGWSVFLYSGNYSPTPGVDAADIPLSVGECVAYDETIRPTWAHNYDGVSLIDNAANRAVFTLNADVRVYGAGIVSSSAKGSGSGILLSLARFAVPRDLPAGTEFAVTAGIVLVPTV